MPRTGGLDRNRAPRLLAKEMPTCTHRKVKRGAESVPHLGQFQSKARFSTWLIQMAIHEVLRRHGLRWSSQLFLWISLRSPSSRLPRKPPRRSSGWNEWRPIVCYEKPSRSCRRKTKRHCAVRHAGRQYYGRRPTARDDRSRGEEPASARPPQNGGLTGALASKARSCADIIQSDNRAIVAQGVAVLEQVHRSEDLIQGHS